MKTKQLINLAFLSGLLLAAGCSDDQHTGTTDNNEPVELQISPRVVLTRGVVNGTAFSNGTSIAVYATGDDYAASNNYAVYMNNSGWSNTGGDKIYLTGKAATIYAYYPTTTKYGADLTIPITLLEGTGSTTITSQDNTSDGTPIAAADGEVDCMYATSVSNVSNKANNGVALNMNHALSMVSFRVYKAADYKGAGNLTKIVMKDINVDGTTLSKGTSPKMNITTGVIAEGAAQDATYTRAISSGYTLGTVDADAKRFSILVLPTSASIGTGNIQAVFTIDGADYSVNLTPPADNSGKWLAGKNHLYSVKLSGTELTISSVTIAQWVGVAGGDLTIQ